MSAIVPIARCAVSVRPGTLDDLAFIDALQKKHTKQVGWFPTKTIEGKINLGHVLVAVDEAGERFGYLIGNDQYFKRDDLGIIYQINIVEGKRRALVGATLLTAQFDRSAYGCKLYCCWCAQDIEANRFWESLGFVPLAFRTGSRDKGPKGSCRVHIFWQRRIREGDCETPYWFPSQTTSGSIREDRLVFPIPPGMSWQDEMPHVLPSEQNPKLEMRSAKQTRNPKSKTKDKPPADTLGRLVFVRPSEAKAQKPKREKKPKAKNDPKLVAAARELRDRWLEQVNADPSRILSGGKYDVSRKLFLQGSLKSPEMPIPLLPAPCAA